MKFLKIAVFFVGLSAFAQGKVGAVDVEYILSQMPELEDVQKQLETYGNQLDIDLNKKVDDYKKLAEEYKAGEASYTVEQKKEKQTVLLNSEADIQKFQQNGAKLMEIKRNEFLSPLYKKIGEALDKVSKAEGYTQVMQISPDMVFLDPNYDLTLPIIKEMGIVIKEQPTED